MFFFLRYRVKRESEEKRKRIITRVKLVAKLRVGLLLKSIVKLKVPVRCKFQKSITSEI